MEEDVDADDDDVEYDAYSDDEDERVLSPSAIAIGRYASCTHYRSGLFSSVYRARDPDAAHPTADAPAAFVALKVTTPSTMAAPHDSAREARILGAVRSPHVVPLLSVFSAPGARLVLAFPFLPLDLARVLRRGRLRPAHAKSHLRDLFAALAHLHAHGVLHRDVKPSNVLLRAPAGPAYLADFGIAWSAADAASEDAADKIADVGTAAYRPPEILFGMRDYGPPLDLWAAGCVAAEAAGGLRSSLFEPGDAGTELALIRSIFASLGTPDLRSWPEAARLPDWGKFEWKAFPARPWAEMLPRASESARDLVGSLVRYENGSRLGAAEVLEHAYFTA